VIQIRRVLFIVLLLLSCAAVLFLGIRDYVLIGGSAELASAEIKLRAESVLYLSIVFSLFQLLVFGVVLLRSRKIFRELDKISDMTRYGNFSIANSLRRLGPLGEKIGQLNQRLTDLNEMKGLRISSLAAVNTFLLNNSRLALMILDITGKVTKISPRCRERLKLEEKEVVGRHISEFVPDLNFQTAVTRIEKQHIELEMSELKESPTLYPVFNRRGELSDLICILGKEEIVTGISKFTEDRTRAASRVTKLVRKYIGSRGKGRRE